MTAPSTPYAVGLLRSDGSVAETGRLKPGGHRAFFEGLRSQPGGWDKLAQTWADGTVPRALSPGHGVTSGVLPGNAVDDYINQVWAKYTASPLTVAPFADRPEVKYHGTVSGGAMNFADGSGQLVTTFQKPDADSVSAPGQASVLVSS
ncbi:beta-1,3-glucanase family protein [Streptomyces sp. NPDC126497]|uniref:beta-1,3-glucanase family protein n=1 Tax=Streptomyces sp. NPDC126497 TaxID=3155313 RepID=UPI00333492B8